MNPAHSIETWLYDQGGWVEEVVLMNVWNATDRRLRRELAGVAVMNREKGWKHISHATSAELETYAKPKLSHAVTELKNLKLLRLNHRRQRRPDGTFAAMATVQEALPLA